MTFVALQLSHYVNGVAKRHGELSRSMFPGYPISSITNGVHSATWTAPALHALYDQYIPDWRQDSFSLRYALGIPPHAIWQAHAQAKRRLTDELNRRVNAGFNQDIFTLGFARRATAYKRPGLLFHDIERLRSIAKLHGGLQLVYAGKAHPKDEYGKGLIYQIVQRGKELGPDVKLAYVPNYDMESGQILTAGVDLWLNTPEPPHEASGTSGMKAAHNGVPSLSVLDGWWLEGHAEGVTGWAIGDRDRNIMAVPQYESDAADLYYKLETKILPLYRDDPIQWAEIMRYTIALNASFFNTQRMLMEYLMYAYQDR
jgi:starch phosphorylase